MIQGNVCVLWLVVTCAPVSVDALFLRHFQGPAASFAFVMSYVAVQGLGLVCGMSSARNALPAGSEKGFCNDAFFMCHWS